MNGLKTALIQGFVVLAAAFIGVWGGREVMNVELRALQEATRANAQAVKDVALAVTALTLQVKELSVSTSEQMKFIDARVRSIEQWQAGIQEDRAKRGEIIPRLEQRIDKLERRRQ